MAWSNLGHLCANCLLSNGYSFSAGSQFGRVLLPVVEERLTFRRVLMIGYGLFIRKVNNEGNALAIGFQSLNEQDVFPVDFIIFAEQKLFFQNEPHFLNAVMLTMEV